MYVKIICIETVFKIVSYYTILMCINICFVRNEFKTHFRHAVDNSGAPLLSAKNYCIKVDFHISSLCFNARILVSDVFTENPQ